MISLVSYVYFLIYELFSPYIEIFGVFTAVLAVCLRFLNWQYWVFYTVIYIVYSSILSLTAFFARVHTIDLKLALADILKAAALCTFEVSCLRLVLAWVRMAALLKNKGRNYNWGKIERKKINFN